ncbi:MAG: hypothetical protein IKB18_05470 [Tidjanibacter sp.]|nr:hypothetical protein [Tidjanibacter sp.]
MKLTKIFAVVVAALVALTACRGTEEEQFQGDGTGFKVTASAGVIYADGTDKVVFTATFDGFALAADAITAYNKRMVTLCPLRSSPSPPPWQVPTPSTSPTTRRAKPTPRRMWR